MAPVALAARRVRGAGCPPRQPADGDKGSPSFVVLDEADLVASVEGTVRSTALAYGRGFSREDREDLFSAGREGASVAAKRYRADHASGAKFNSYAIWWIRLYVNREAARIWSGGRFSSDPSTSGMSPTIRVFMRAGRAAQVDDDPAAAADVGASVDSIRAVLAATSPTVPYDEPASPSGDEEGRFPLADRLADEAARDPFEEAAMSQEADVLRRLVRLLDPPARYAVEQRYFAGRDVDEIAGDFRWSPARVRTVLARAVRELREALLEMWEK